MLSSREVGCRPLFALVALLVLSIPLGACDTPKASTGSSPASIQDQLGIGHFGVTVRNSEIRVDIVLFEHGFELSGRCNGVQLGGNPEDSETSFVIAVDGGPLDDVTCQLKLNGAGVTVAYEPTADVLRRVIGSGECVVVGNEGHWKCPADASVFDGDGVLIAAPWFVTDPEARATIEGQ